MNFVELFTLESQINTEYEWIWKWTTENIVEKLAIQVNVHWENTTIVEYSIFIIVLLYIILN